MSLYALTQALVGRIYTAADVMVVNIYGVVVLPLKRRCYGNSHKRPKRGSNNFHEKFIQADIIEIQTIYIYDSNTILNMFPSRKHKWIEAAAMASGRETADIQMSTP